MKPILFYSKSCDESIKLWKTLTGRKNSTGPIYQDMY